MINPYDIVELLVDQGAIKAGSQGTVVDKYDIDPSIVTVEFWPEVYNQLTDEQLLLDVSVEHLKVIKVDDYNWKNDNAD